MHRPFPELFEEIFGQDGFWSVVLKDVEQMIDSPSHFDPVTQPRLGTGTNLSTMILIMSAIESVAKLANLGENPGNATASVKALGERYFVRVNPRYETEPRGELVVALWDAYRNGGLHNYFPKVANVALPGGRAVEVVFSVVWLEKTPKWSLSLAELRAAWSTRARTWEGHLQFTLDEESANGSFGVYVQVMALELFEAIALYAEDLRTDTDLQQRFCRGFEAFTQGRALRSHHHAWVIREVTSLRDPGSR